MNWRKHSLALLFSVALTACGATNAADNESPPKSPPQSEQPSSGWTPDRYDIWVNSRAGTGEPVYWYSEGTLRAFPGGELLYKLEGYDIARARRVSDTLTEQYSRKIYVYRDPVTNEVVKTANGQSVDPIAYPYQFITYEYKTDKSEPYLQTMVEQGKGAALRSIGPGTDISVRQIGDLQLYTAPLFLDFPIGDSGARYQTFENYDFVIPQDPSQPGLITFMRYGPLPKFAQKDGLTQGAMHMATVRIADYADVPKSLRDYVEAEAPLWTAPPQDLADIRRLQEAE